MRLSAEIRIDADRETVWAAFADLTARTGWQANLKDIRLLTGEAGAANSSYQLTYDRDGRQSTAIESITEVRQPDFMAVIIDDDQAKWLIVSSFTDAEGGGTIWQRFSNSSFHGLARLSAPFRIGSIRRGFEDDMQRFKLMVETREAGKKR